MVNRPDVTGPTEDVLAEFARAIGADIRMVWRVYALARQQAAQSEPPAVDE